jgi:putative transcriptional regulator
MDLLRDKSRSTQMLILQEIVTGHHFRQAAIAKKIGVTKQAVSEYLKKMREKKLVTVIDGEYRATMQGTQVLHAQLLSLKHFLDDSMRKLEIIETGAALAGNNITAGDRVGLVMEDGRLMAYSGRKAPSTGVAMNGAQLGEDVAIQQLEGMVNLNLGTISILDLPTSEIGGSRRTDTQAVRQKLVDLAPDRVGIMGVVATAVMQKIGQPGDFLFAVPSAAIEAAQRGLDVAVVCSGNDMERLLAEIKEYNAASATRLPYELISFIPKTIKKS